MALESYTLTPARTPSGRAKKNTFEVMVPDATFLSATIQKIAASEINAQQKIGNPPQNLIVDNKDSKAFNQAQFRVVALFSDPKIVALATVRVIQELQKMTRKLTGAARGSYQIWTADSFKLPARKRINAATSASVSTLTKLATTLPVGGQLIVVGPLVEYGRKLYWNPMGQNKDYKYKGRARYSAAYDVETGALSRVRTGSNDTNMWDLVKGRVKRRYPGVKILGRWVKGKMINGDNRWPGVSISLATKGALK